MFTSEKQTAEERLDDLLARARSARDAGRTFFQIYLPADERAAWLEDHETAGAVEALEAEGWTLENVAEAGAPPDPAYARIETPVTATVVGTIYTFRAR
jgi:hypothetical protein